MYYSIRFKRIKLIPKEAFNFCFLPVVLITCLISSSNAFAQGNLLIYPKRILFDASKRIEELNLSNIGKDSATYVISVVQIRMKEDGGFEKITQPDSAQFFADKNLRFFPRTVTLAPQEAQTVKVQITRTNELTTGEYRSHLYFRAIPKEKPLGEPEPVKDSTSLSVKLVPVFGISIPVIIRVGENTSAVKLSNVSLKNERDTIPTLNMTFNRTGNMSVYGDVSVNHISLEGRVTPVGSAKGIAVYSPTASRRFNLYLYKNYGIDFNSGKLHILYEDESHKVKLAEEEIDLH